MEDLDRHVNSTPKAGRPSEIDALDQLGGEPLVGSGFETEPETIFEQYNMNTTLHEIQTAERPGPTCPAIPAKGSIRNGNCLYRMPVHLLPEIGTRLRLRSLG